MATEPAQQRTDEELVLAIRDGSHGAFSELVTRHSGKFYGLAFRYTANREAAEDIVQTVFLRLWEKPYLFAADRQVKFTTWFYQVVVNACLDQKKKKTPLALDDGVEVVDGRNRQDDMLMKKKERLRLEQAIQSLPARQQTALNLCFYEELSQQEAAEVMGVPIKALQSLVMRAKTNLKKQLGT